MSHPPSAQPVPLISVIQLITIILQHHSIYWMEGVLSILASLLHMRVLAGVPWNGTPSDHTINTAALSRQDGEFIEVAKERNYA